MSNTHATVRCLLIPIGDGQILLPSVVIAEVSPDMEVSSETHTMGFINWRGQRVPLISLEQTLSLPVIATKKARTVILYGLDYTQTMPFYAFKTTDVPRTHLVKEESLTYSKEVSSGLVFTVSIDKGDTIWIPDLNYLENIVHKTLTYE